MATLNKNETRTIIRAAKLLQKVKEGTFDPNAEPLDMKVLSTTIAELSMVAMMKGAEGV